VSFVLDHRQTVWQWGLMHKGKGEEKDIVCSTPTRLKDFIRDQTLSNSAKELWLQFLERNYIRNIQNGDGFTLFLTSFYMILSFFSFLRDIKFIICCVVHS
jgi:hypothetical protein